ncbi:DNA polymerase delta subunit 3 isoform X2 [Rhineura floridana]|nr:DNA polymerase delta subunit 3 isoform X2 [Rhineura floridana]
MKSQLSTVAGVHVYSIQKAMLKDSSPLYNTDYDIIKANLQNCSRFSAIHCAAAVARTAAEMAQIKTPAQADSQPPHGANAVAPVVNGHAPSTSAKQISQQAKGIMGMFAAAAAKSATKSQDVPKETNLEAKEPPSTSTASGKAPAKGNLLNNFFGKAAMSKVSAEPEQRKEDKAADKSPLEPKLPPDVPGLEKPAKKADPAKGQQKDKKRTKRLDEEEEAESLTKKRRRIKLLQSSSSDDEDVPESPVTPEVKDVSSEPDLNPELDPMPIHAHASAGEKRRKRKRVLKCKTFVDEEGCIVTEKAYESESCTDSEEEFRSKPPATHRRPAGAAKKDPKEEKKAAKRGGAAASKANKQASIMGFFQKK